MEEWGQDPLPPRKGPRHLVLRGAWSALQTRCSVSFGMGHRVVCGQVQYRGQVADGSPREAEPRMIVPRSVIGPR